MNAGIAAGGSCPSDLYCLDFIKTPRELNRLTPATLLLPLATLLRREEVIREEVIREEVIREEVIIREEKRLYENRL